MKSGKESGSVDVVFNWLKPDGKPLLTETRKMTFYAHPSSASSISISTSRRSTRSSSVTPRKARSPCAWRRRSRSRLPRRSRARPARTGKLINAQGGEREANVWGKRSEWVDYSGELDGEKVGVVMMDHPDNPRHPDVLALTRVWAALDQSVRRERLPQRQDTERQPDDRAGAARPLPLPSDHPSRAEDRRGWPSCTRTTRKTEIVLESVSGSVRRRRTS